MKKRKIKISTAIPASMSEITATENPHLTSAKLRVFHQGKTEDGRYFTKAFADKLAATIGGTPVVASYDEESEDFIGHDLTQSVFGFVPEDVEVWTEVDEDGNSWLLTEVKLFTERHDVGTIAKKIIGRSQSLELNPETVKINFVSTEEDEVSLIEFVDGDLIGLSVLGASQQPAFAGSGFFEASTDSLKEIIAKYISIPNEIVMETGGGNMKVILFQKDGVTIFKRDGRINIETHDGAHDDITDAIREGMGNVIEGEEGKENEDEGLGDQSGVDPAEAQDGDPEVDPDPEVTPEEDPEPQEEDGEAEGEEGEGEADEGEFESEDADDEEDPEGVESQTEEAAAHAAALAEAEREELNNYRRERKISIIESYREFLTESQLQEFKDRVDEYDNEGLEKELAFAGMNNVRQQNNSQPAFSFSPRLTQTNNDDDITGMIRQYNEVE